jgi:Glycosyl hydrolase family 20, domain 2
MEAAMPASYQLVVDGKEAKSEAGRNPSEWQGNSAKALAMAHRRWDAGGVNPPRQHLLGVVAALVVTTGTELVADPFAPDIIPKPMKIEVGQGAFELTGQTAFVARPGAEIEGEELAAALRRPTGFGLGATTPRTPNRISLQLEPSLEPRLGTQGYSLVVQPTAVFITAASAAGLFYGGITLRQLLPPAIWSPHT